MKDRLKKKLKRIKLNSVHKALPFPFNSKNKAEIDSAIASGMEHTENLFIFMRQEKPQLFQEFRDIVIKDMSSDEVEDFYSRVAQKEAYKAGKISEPPPPYKIRERKVYEMPAEYQQNLEKLNQLLKKREEYLAVVSDLSPEARAETSPTFQDLNTAIENIEQELADEYERYQEEQDTLETQLSAIAVERWLSTAKQYLFIQKYQPRALTAFKEACMEDEEWIHIARWIDRLVSENYDPPPVVLDKK